MRQKSLVRKTQDKIGMEGAALPKLRGRVYPSSRSQHGRAQAWAAARPDWGCARGN